MRERSVRRHYAEKFKRRCRLIIHRRFSFDSEDLTGNAKFVGKLARTRKPCSCFMCGNPRKYFNEKTIRERRQQQAN